MTHNRLPYDQATFVQAILFAFGLTTVGKAARALDLPVQAADRLLSGLPSGDPEAFVPWVEADQRRAKAWEKVAAMPVPAAP